ncbi:MAG: hypothetical protein JWM28_2972 [Chitinophagaceae bacterium]|nr:hypothetical protein [Chitinophagaceae bacterium]
MFQRKYPNAHSNNKFVYQLFVKRRNGLKCLETQ